ncbi:probable UDP-glucosyl transferase 73B6 [Mercurialis annua]|uniref:probable UDP-glucosyl transferase 73B6 n=1 Tax=Mercurialis annua TaxID=3986 RepID=UPI00215E1964|nr:probable UDP-glucosyl transferase 73B6 [Mercurialis annua]
MALPEETHVVIFPFMAQGHTLPLLDLSKALSRQQIKVSIITTPGNAKSISKNISSSYNSPLISLIEIPFPAVDGLPVGCENTSQLPSMEFHLHFVQATKNLKKPFEEILKTMVESESPPVCVISDFFLGWTLAVCQSLGVPRLVFHGMGVLSMAISKTVWVHQPHLKATSDFEPLEMPGMKLPFSLTAADLPDSINLPDHDDPMSQIIDEVGAADANSWGIVVNSFEELERSHIPSFEAFYGGRAKAWCLGPLVLYDKVEDNYYNDDGKNSSALMQFLSEQITPKSAIYVSFGTQAVVSDAQLDEVAFGLHDSEFSFLWVVRSKTWRLPDELEEKIKGKGFITNEWVDQRKILSHRSTGGFLSHCGWNSVLESVSAGVPILAWPMIAEQPLNAKLIVDGLGAGMSIKRVRNSESGVAVTRRDICDGVRELMGGEKGRNARERAEALGRVARRAVQKGGSSDDSLRKMIDKLRAC